jgi:hypothetical protein
MLKVVESKEISAQFLTRESGICPILRDYARYETALKCHSMITKHKLTAFRTADREDFIP